MNLSHWTDRWYWAGASRHASRELRSRIQKSRASPKCSFCRSCHPGRNQSEPEKPTCGTTNLVPRLLRSTLVCQATPNRPSSFMTSSSGRTCMASSNRKDANTIHSHHHVNSLMGSGSWSSTTKSSIDLTTCVGMGIASFRVRARLLITSAWIASNPWWSISGHSIASLAVTHLTEVLKVGITEGPHSRLSKCRAYWMSVALVKGKTSIPLASAHSANRSQLATWVAIVLGAPHERTSCRRRATSAWDRPFSFAVSSNNFEKVPAFRPISSSLAAHFQRAAFSWSSSGVAEGASWLAFKNFLGGLTGFHVRALIASALRALAVAELIGGAGASHNPKPSWWAVDSKNARSTEQASDQNCSNIKVERTRSSLMASSNLGAHSTTFSTNSCADPTSIAATKAKLAKGDPWTALANTSSNTGNERILLAHLSGLWAMVAHCQNPWGWTHDLKPKEPRASI